MRAVRSSRHDQRRLRKTRVELDDNSQMHVRSGQITDVMRVN